MRLAHRSGIAVQTGLTLVELVVAVALLAILTLMAYRGVDSVARSAEHTQAEAERWRSLSGLFERLGADVSQATRRPVRASDDSVLPEWLGSAPVDAASAEVAAGEDQGKAQLEFTRKSPPGADDVRLGYRLRQARVELLIWPVLDRAPDSAAEVHPLVDGVRSLRFRHLDSAGKWNDAWPLNDKREPLPRALAVELTLTDGVVLQRVWALP